MQSTILTGVAASGTIVPGPRQGVQIEHLEIDLPLDDVGSTDPNVTLSGSTAGATTFHGDTSPKLRFGVDETVYVTTANFTADYSAIIKYVSYGDQQLWKDTRHKSELPLPSRLTR